MTQVITSDQMIPQLSILAANPTALTRLWLRTLEQVTDGAKLIVDPSHPVYFQLAASCSMASAAMVRNATLTAKQYPSMSQSVEDLYRHMSDKDYLGRFATPAMADIIMVMSVDEIRAVADWVRNSSGAPDGSGVKKISIPRHSEIQVAGTTFAMQYQIDIRVMPHGGIVVTYVGQPTSPLYTLISNVVNHGFLQVRGKQYLRLTIPVQQMSVSSQIAQLNGVSGFARIYNFTDQFYYCRAYVKNQVDNAWVEVLTTHDALVYDPTQVTVQLAVFNNQLRVTVPQLYFNTGLAKDSLRLDIYTTKGPIDLNLGSYAETAFQATWIDRDYGTDNGYMRPLDTFSNRYMYSDSVVQGGTLGVDYSTLRRQVITNSLQTATTPITAGQLVSTLAGNGYDTVTNLDTVTNRQFLATRPVNAPTNGDTVSGAGCSIQVFQTTMADLVKSRSVVDNGEHVTIKPSALFQSTDGVPKLVADTAVDTLVALGLTSPTALATAINSGSYFYTPFYWVLDTSNGLFGSEAYRLDNPTVVAKSFYQDNPPLAIEVSTAGYVLTNDEPNNRYVLILRLAAGATFTALSLDQYGVQMSYVPPGLDTRVYLNGTLQLTTDGTNDIYLAVFNLDTRYDFNINHHLVLEPYQTPVQLTTEFDLVYYVKDPDGIGPTSLIDAYFDASKSPDYDITAKYRGIIQEKLTLKFGDWLEHLWTRTRTVVSGRTYNTYPADVLAFYAEDIYLRDSTGNLSLGYDPDTGELTTTKLHSVGDPVMVDGVQQVLHRAGDVILDADGMPTYLNGDRGLLRQIDLMLVDGGYYFATDESTVAYRTEFVDAITTWVTEDIGELAKRLLERTDLYFYPKTTTGAISVVVGHGLEIRVPAGQSWVVEYYMDSERIKNEALKEAITKRTAQLISAALQENTVAHMNIVASLRDAMSEDVISLRVYSEVLGESDATTTRYQAFTITDQSMRPAVGKRMVALSNLKLAMRDAVSVSFIEH